MADVDLSVAVTSTGVQAAIAQLENLTNKGLTTAAAMGKLSTESGRATQAIADQMRAMAGTSRSYEGAATAVQHLTTSLEVQKRAYQQYASLRVGATPAERLAGAFGGAARGRSAAEMIRLQQEAFNADPVRDLIAVEQEEQALLAARGRVVTAQGELARAQWERELAAMTPVEAAKARLIRATQELATATRLVNVTNERAAANPTAANLNAQTAATQRLTAATRDYQTAKNGLATAQEREAHAGVANENNAFQSSYSYFILAGLATKASQSIINLGTASITASTEIERSFADVERTFEGTDAQLSSLQDRLFELSTSTPISVIDLAQIATLGNQLGIAAEDIESFTRVIAMYTAVSGQSAEDAATAFGRISNLTGLAASQYSNLASAITYTARTTVATESTIQNTAKEITALASGAGFSADAIVGLAGALSSLAIPPERARGALSLYFGALNTAVAEGGPKLAAFAELTNMTADQLNRLVRENRGQEVFTAFISGLSQLDTVAKTSALDTLGLSTIRVDQTMRALSQNVPLVTQSLEGANRAFRENTEITNQYGIIQATLSAKWQEFQNAVQNVAAAVGDEFAPAAGAVLEALTSLLVTLDKVSDSPIGQAFLKFATAAGIVLAGLTALVGVLALTKASLVVLSFAVRQLGWESATTGLKSWVMALVSTDKATRSAALSTTAFSTAVKQSASGITASTVATKGLTIAMNALKIALPIIAITAAIALIDQWAGAIDKAINPSKRLTDDISGLKDALISDNPNAFRRGIEQVGDSSTKIVPKLSDFNQSILTAIQVQKQAEGQINSTSGAIDAQAFSLGETSKAWIADALKNQEDIKDIIDGSDFWETLWETIFQPGSADEFVSRDTFEKLIMGGLDVNQISQIAIEQGEEAAYAAYDAWQEGYAKADPNADLAGATVFRSVVLPKILSSVTDAYRDAAFQAALAGSSISDTGEVVAASAADFRTLSEAGTDVDVTFSGVTDRLDDLRDALQGAISGTVSFDSVLDRAKETAQEAADAYNKLHKDAGIDAAPIDAAKFGEALESATTDALNFYQGIMKLAEGGNTSFALQLAELGPEAQGILSSSLELDSDGQARLEAAARFAAFLASDAFKNALEANMQDSNEAYGIIFGETGNLADVQSYIAAQVAGVGEAWEKQWAVDHPNLPLNVTPELKDPTEDQIAYFQDQLSGRITVTPKIVYSPTGQPYTDSNTYTDNVTGAKITLPASLDGAALSSSLDIWKQDQSASPEEIAAKLNEDGLSASLDAWRAAHGNITIRATILPNTPYFNGSLFSASGNQPKKRDGGIIGRDALPGFASGGGYGMFRGPGSGISDSILARVSAGEYISTAAATKFWGPDFFESLNRKMLPTNFLNMLGAAAVSGNRGPERVAYVTVQQNNPLTRDPLKQLREDSENVAAGIWGD